MRAEALVFAAAHAADWLSMSLEDLQQAPSAWEGMSAHEEIRLPEPRNSPEIDSDTQVQQVQQGGPA